MSSPLTWADAIDALHLYSRLYDRAGEILALLGLAAKDQYFALGGLEELDLEKVKTATFSAHWRVYYGADTDDIEHGIPVRYLWMSDEDILAEDAISKAAAKAARRVVEINILEQKLSNAIRYRSTAVAGAQLAVDRAERDLQALKDQRDV